MTKFDENEEMVAMLKHFKGSLENKIRQAYNSGYGDGFEAGARECLDDVRRTLEKSLRQQIEQTEPQTDNGIGCSKCESRFWCMDRDMPHAVHCNNYGKTEQTEREGE